MCTIQCMCMYVSYSVIKRAPFVSQLSEQEATFFNRVIRNKNDERTILNFLINQPEQVFSSYIHYGTDCPRTSPPCPWQWPIFEFSVGYLDLKIDLETYITNWEKIWTWRRTWTVRPPLPCFCLFSCMLVKANIVG